MSMKKICDDRFDALPGESQHCHDCDGLGECIGCFFIYDPVCHTTSVLGNSHLACV